MAESTDDPTAINPSSGDSGLYGFAVGTWLTNGGGQYAPQALDAAPWQQDNVALWTYERSGWSPWASDAGKCGT